MVYMSPVFTVWDCHVGSKWHKGDWEPCYGCDKIACELHAQRWEGIWLCKVCQDKRGLQMRLEDLRDAVEAQISKVPLTMLEELVRLEERIRNVLGASYRKDFVDIERLRRTVEALEMPGAL